MALRISTVVLPVNAVPAREGLRLGVRRFSKLPSHRAAGPCAGVQRRLWMGERESCRERSARSCPGCAYFLRAGLANYG